MEGGFEQVLAEGAALVQLRFLRVAPPQQFLHPRHDLILLAKNFHWANPYFLIAVAISPPTGLGTLTEQVAKLLIYSEKHARLLLIHIEEPR